MAEGPIVIDTPDGIAFARLASLKGALSLECKGMRRSRGPSAYSILKRDYGYKGSKTKVLELVSADIERILKEREEG